MSEAAADFNGYRFLPPSLAAWIRSHIESQPFEGQIPWTPLKKPLSESRLALVTTAGINHKDDPPFDMEREKKEPTWGDPTYRKIPKGSTSADIDVNHLHINTDYIQKDLNVMLPLQRMAELAEEGVVGSLAPTAYSFYGFQLQGDGFLETAVRPMAEGMKNEEVDAVLLTPA